MLIKPGDKLYRVNRGKSVMLAVVGDKSLSEGVSIGAAHTGKNFSTTQTEGTFPLL